jgi:iron only hydrogenase large subunit-like protein
MHQNCYHVSIQPCYDKKIESFRGDDVDLILTPKEIIQFLEEQKVFL